MANIFSSYTSIVRRMLRNYDTDLYNFFCDQNIQEEWEHHDNWNGGIDYYRIIVKIPVEFFSNLRKRGVVEEKENVIESLYRDAMRGDDDSIQLSGVYLKPSANDIVEFGDNIDDTMWRPGYFRLFISHLSANKISASNLKSCLAFWGIDCFVAHEDITPSKEWEKEIEKGLFTMDALCAIVVPDFIKSQWCDQEVGIALGLRKLVISINKGEVPYGFFGKYQALKSKNKNANEIAIDVWKAISTNDKTKSIYENKLVAIILNATSENDALHFIDVIKQCDNVSKHQIENLHDNFISNGILNSVRIINAINPLFQKYGLSSLSQVSQSDVENNYDNLPF